MNEKIINALQSISQSLLFQLQRNDNDDIVLEVLKAYGNLTRCSKLRDSVLEDNKFQLFLRYTSSSDELIQQAALGIYINATGHSETLQTWLLNNSARKDFILSHFLDLLRKTSIKSIESSTLICKVLDKTHNLIAITLL